MSAGTPTLGGVCLLLALTLPREARTVAHVRELARHALDLVGSPAAVTSDACLAVSEACANAVEHAGAGDHYDVVLDVNPDRFIAVVTDQGHGASHEVLHAAMPAPSARRGRGLPLIRALADEASITSAPGVGTVVRIVKRLTGR
jgi:serine/threonine-protein kinase RsbW